MSSPTWVASWMGVVKPRDNPVVLDWGTRFKIAIGSAKGLAHIHEKYDGTFEHGNIKASNIFLNSKQYGCCLGNPTPLNFKMSRYHPPEVSSNKMLSQKSDIYSFGVFLIELVSGRSPTLSTGRFKSYVDWARYFYREEWAFLIYDIRFWNIFKEKEMRGKKQMFDMLQIAMSCVRDIPTMRPNMNIVVEMIYKSMAEPPLIFFKKYAKWID
ncbi:hypothetical protein RD792_005427 [Penstemon davidsonii]|uniref:Protein kinase domain-containing protein n=1 Tax=Penstemon davidsonii TaxID=160366 RepID=A0ABR0DK50_9LAMI|nr:hypothetical protein RD792_005427 [Penstemon davidsonii]